MNIPTFVKNIIKDLEKAGFEAYIVGGCVRDLLMDNPPVGEPKDWDVTTNAKPEEMLKIFPDGKYENDFGTVLVPVVQKTENRKQKKDLKIITSSIKISKKDKEKAIAIAKSYLEKIECPAHGFNHAKNVVSNVLEIAKDYKDINEDILEISAWFHDVGRVKYDDHRHNEESLKIIKKELGFLSKKALEVILVIANHSKFEESECLEQHILKEADMIDALDLQRSNIAKEIKLKDHFKWIEERFNWENFYPIFFTEASKNLLKENIKRFNEENFGFKLPKFNIAVEATTYRSEQGYSDRRHPDDVKFETELDKDLERRDFTMNALALGRNKKSSSAKASKDKQETSTKKIPNSNPPAGRAGFQIPDGWEIVDLFGGIKDIDKKIIRAVGEPSNRFKEDALRMMRAIRFSAQLGFEIEPKTERAISKLASSIRFVSNERISDELIKILKSDRFYDGMMNLHKTKLLQYILPEIEAGVGVKQDRHHIYDVFKHSMEALKHTPSKDWRVRFASMLHDIGKVKTRKIIGGIATFYNHEIISANQVKKIMKRLHFSNKDMEKIDSLIRYHMFYYNVGEVTEASVRRLIRKVGKENLKDLIDLRIADRLGSGVPKAKPYKLRHLEYMMEKVQNDPVSVKMLKLNGDYMIAEMGFEPGPKMGAILDVLLSEVIEDPKRNTLKYLKKRAEELNKEDIKDLRKKAKEVIEEKREKDDKEIKKEFYVK